MKDRGLYLLVLVAAILSAGHHLDHMVRGNHVGWPLTAEVNSFTYSLGIYPAMLIGSVLYRRGRVGPGFWLLLSGGGALFIAVIHFVPGAIEPPGDIIDHYQSPILGWIAFAWLVLFEASLVVASLYELRLLRRRRREAGDYASAEPPV